MEYTLRVFKQDARTKSGEKHIADYDYGGQTKQFMENEVASLKKNGYYSNKYRFEIVETYVRKQNLLSGEEFLERFDTPIYCSPSSESYWSM